MPRINFFWLVKAVYAWVRGFRDRIAVVVPHGYYDIDNDGKISSAGRKPDTGGQTIFCWELFGWMSRIPGIKVDMFHRGFGDYPEIFTHERFPNLRMVRIKCGPSEFVRKEELYGPILDEFVDNMLAFIKKEGQKYTVVHGHYADGGYVAGRVARALGRPFFFTFHSLGAGKKRRMEKADDPKEKIWAMNFEARTPVEEEILRSADCIMATTLDEGEQILMLYGIRPRHHLFLPPGYDGEIFHPSAEKGERPSHLPEKYVLMAPGRLVNAKGHHLLLQAFVHVRKKHPDVKLVIVGGDPDLDKNTGEQWQHLRLMHDIIEEEHSLQDAVVHLAGMPQSELIKVIRHALVYVSPAGFEPFGMTLVEAAACALACVFSEKAGASQLFKDGEDSFIVNPFDEVSLAGVIIRMLDSPAMAKEMGEKAAIVASQLSWEKLARKQLAAYFGIGLS